MELWQRGGYENGMDIPEVGAWSVVAAGEESQTINESVTWPDGYIYVSRSLAAKFDSLRRRRSKLQPFK